MGEIVRLAAERLDGSEVTTVPPHQIGLAEALLAENTDPRDLTGAATRNGQALVMASANLGSVGNAVNGVKAWTRDAGTSFVLARVVTSLYSLDSSSYASVALAWGTVGGVFRAQPLANTLVLVVDGSTISTWDGTTFGTLGGGAPTSAKYIAQFVSKIFVAGDSSNPQTKYFSATNNPADWAADEDAGSITTQDGGGDTIRGLVSNNKVLLTLYRNYIDVLIGDSTFNFREERLINKGLVSETGYASHGEVAFVASDDCIIMVAGTTVSDLTTGRIRETYKNIADKSKITLLVKGDLLLVIDYGASRAAACAYKYGRWSEWTRMGYKTGDTSNDQTMYAGGNGGSTSTVVKLDTGSLDIAATITASWRTGNFGFGWDDAIKNLLAVRLHAKPGMGTVTVQFYKNGGSYGSTNELTFGTAGQHDWAGRAGQSAVRGHYIGFKASWSGAGTLYGWAMYAEITTQPGTIPVEI